MIAKAVAFVGLLFFIYCLVQVLRTWNSRERANKAVWFIIIAVGAGTCLGVLFR